MDSIRSRTRRGTLRLEANSDLESVDDHEEGPKARGDGEDVPNIEEQQVKTAMFAPMMEVLDEVGDGTVRPKQTANTQVTAAQSDTTLGENDVFQAPLIHESTRRNVNDTTDVASCGNQGGPVTGPQRTSEVFKGDGKPGFSLLERRPRIREGPSLDTLEFLGGTDQLTQHLDVEQPARQEYVPTRSQYTSPWSGDLGRGLVHQGPMQAPPTMMTTSGDGARQPRGRTVLEHSHRREGEIPDREQFTYGTQTAQQASLYGNRDADAMFGRREERQATKVSRSSRSQRSIGARRSREDTSSSSGDGHDRPRNANHGRAKLPPFTGKERWEVWYNRFKDVAARRGWSTERMLDELIPLIQGQAGDFVYGQLSDRIRRSYDLLIQELTYRYRTVEPRRTMGAKFSHRVQKPAETIQEFGADLKRLYDKAHPDRDRQTRSEDLLRRFLDGLRDDNASFHVEYVKEPADIDEAVNEVMNFVETRRRPDSNAEHKKNKRAGRVVSDEDSDDMDRVARLPGRPPKNPGNNKNPAPAPVTKPPSGPPGPGGDPCLAEVRKIRGDIQQLAQRVEKLENDRPTRQVPSTRPPVMHARPGPQNRANHNNTDRPRGCFKCGQEGHFARGCMNTVMGQFQMTTPDTRFQFHQGTNGPAPGLDRNDPSSKGN